MENLRLRCALRVDQLPLLEWQERCIDLLLAVEGIEVVMGLLRRKAAQGFLSTRPNVDWLNEQEAGVFAQMQPGLDLLIDLSQEVPLDEAVPLRYGVWAFRTEQGEALSQLALAELLRNQRSVIVRFVMFVGSDVPCLLEEGVFRPVSHSRRLTRQRILASLAEWPARHAWRLSVTGELRFTGALPATTLPRDRSRWTPVLVPLALIRNALMRLLQLGVEEHWTIGAIERPAKDLLNGFDPGAIRWFPELPGTCLADPFPVWSDGRMWLLAEAYPIDSGRGQLVLLQPGLDPGVGEIRPAIQHASHLSYPFPVHHEGSVYVVPEASNEGCVRLFRGDPFPHRFVEDRVLIDGFAGVDPTVFRHDGRWWLLAASRADQMDAKLYAFFADDFLGPWTPHPMNPVKTDLRSSRPAGPPFESGGQLFRPAQDCSIRYGVAVVINRVVQLDPLSFTEETVAVLSPDPRGPYPHGLHTLAGTDDVTFVDGKRETFSLARLRASLCERWATLRKNMGRV